MLEEGRSSRNQLVHLPIHAFLRLAFLELPVFPFEEVIQSRPELLKVVERYAETARRPDLVDVNNDNGSGTGYGLDVVQVDEG